MPYQYDDDEEDLPTRQDVPDNSLGQAPTDALDKYRIDPQQLAAVRRKQAVLSALGGIGDSLANHTSFGHIMLGATPMRQDISGTFNKMGQQAEQALKDQAMLKQQAIARPKEALEQQKYDPNSGLTGGQNAVSEAVAKALGNKELGSSLQGKSAAEQEAILGQPSVKELIGLKGAEAKAAGFSEPKFESVAKGLNSEYTGNSLLKMLDGQQAKLNDLDQIVTDIRAGKKKFDVPTAHEMNRILVGIGTQSSQGGLGVQEKTEWQAPLASIKNQLAKITDQDIDESTPATFNKLMATRDAMAKAMDATRRNKIARIAQGHMALVGKNPYVMPVIQQNLNANGMSMSDLQNFKPYSFAETSGPMHGGSPAPSVKSGQVKVMKGKESYFIDPKDLEGAQADGFKVVQ